MKIAKCKSQSEAFGLVPKLLLALFKFEQGAHPRSSASHIGSNGANHILGLLTFICLALFSSTAFAAPEIRNVNIRGLQIGAKTTITIDGSDLLPAPQILMSVPIKQQTVQPKATANRVVFDVTLDEKTVPGIYNLWLANAKGISGRVVIAADRLPQLPFAPEIKSLPAALHGAIGGSAKLRTSFVGKKDQDVLIEVEATRLGGKLRPVLHLYDEAGKHLAWTMPSPALRSDTRLQAKLQADGKYTIELHDLQYAAPTPNHFRLKIGTWQFADQVFPLAVQQGKPASLELIGNVAAGQNVTLSASRQATQQPIPWQKTENASGLRPAVLISQIPELVEDSKATQEKPQQFPAIPSAINGRLATNGEEDRYLLTVKPGDKLRFDLFAARVGSPMDAALEIQNEKGGRLAFNDDTTNTTDSRLDYSVPAKTEKIFVVVKDANGSGGRSCIYRVVATTPDANAANDFILKVEKERYNVGQGNRIVVKVTAERRGYDGPIRLTFDRLPPGVQVQGGEIAAGATGTLLTLHGAGTSIAQALTTLRGESIGLTPPVVRLATDATHPVADMQPWLSRELAFALGQTSTIDFDVQFNKLPNAASLVLGGKLDIPVRGLRPVGFDGPIRLSIVTSQATPLTNGRPDANKSLRQAAAVEIASDAQAVATYNAKVAVDKEIATARANATKIAAAGAKTRQQAAAQVKTATDAKTVADKAAIAVASLFKAAQTTQAVATQALAETTTAAKAATDAATAAKEAAGKAEPADKATADSKAASAEQSAVAAAKTMQDAAAKRAAADKAAAAAATKQQAAIAVQANATKALTTAQANAKTLTDAAAKADAQAAAAVKAAETKLAAAIKAATNAATLAKNEATFGVIVPPTLETGSYELALRAELLSRDKRQVLASSVTAVRHLNVLNPVAVSLSQTAPLTTSIDPKTGATVSVIGKVERRGGQQEDVTVTLSGLPGGIAVPKVVVKKGATDFKLDIKFPANFKPGKLGGVKLFGTGSAIPKGPVVRSEEVDVALELQAAKVKSK